MSFNVLVDSFVGIFIVVDEDEYDFYICYFMNFDSLFRVDIF